MNRLNYRTALCSCGLLWLFVAIGVSANEDQEAKQGAYREDFAKIEEAGKRKDLSSLMNISKQLQTRWRGKDIAKYARLMNRLCGALWGSENSDRAQIAGVAREAISFIDRQSAERISAEVLPSYWELQAGYLSARYRFYAFERGVETHDDDLWCEQRFDVASRAILTLEKVGKVIDPNWKKDMALHLQAELPSGVPPDISPEAIKDPTLRAEYEKRIEENAARNEWWKVQRNLHDLQRSLLKAARSEIPAMYSTPPYNDEELKDLLSKHMKDLSLKDAILSAVQDRKAEHK